MQAWYLRKCMTLYNDVVRRLHLPREHAIRRILLNTGIDLTQYGPCQEEEPHDLETSESEEELEDDPCFLDCIL